MKLSKYCEEKNLNLSHAFHRTVKSRLKGRTEEVYSHYLTYNVVGKVSSIMFFVRSTKGYDCFLEISADGIFKYEKV